MMDSLEFWGTPLLFVSLSFSLFLLCLPSRHVPPGRDQKPRVVVVVLGDIGRSPRMQYHALSIARKGGLVDLVGYDESAPRPELVDNPNIKMCPLPPPPGFLRTGTPIQFILFAPLKALFQLTSMLYLLCYIIPPSAGYILLQNPPAIPTLAVTKLVGALRGMKIVIDWHNFGWSVLRLKLKEHPIVYFCKIYEMFVGRGAYANFTVTDLMGLTLKNDWGVKTPIKTLYDRPPAHFTPLSPEERNKFLESHPVTAHHASAIASGSTRLLISSTSWTPDEDFSHLLGALLIYDRWASGVNFLKQGSAPSVLAVITGKGQLRDGYMARVETLEFQYVTIESVWLEPEDYPKMVGCADLGVSLHTSTSGVDLPMKVVDLFGVGVPVAAFEYLAIRELVKDGVNGIVFRTGEELGDALVDLFNPASLRLKKLREGALDETENRWDENWDKVAAPVLGL
ncbi:Glycosyltransferase Family 33 protein [Tuber magnatum]|uniref:Chitobiosyldiphosphodolichol beta-mannosyltransferase n=1 Tax=Tuber magnatum TaxID=42249 RepID=A0A317SFD8_9PEZI|nr:Glycosyltransferase Family 33 protein [Tuber magnatum]